MAVIRIALGEDENWSRQEGPVWNAVNGRRDYSKEKENKKCWLSEYWKNTRREKGSGGDRNRLWPEEELRDHRSPCRDDDRTDIFCIARNGTASLEYIRSAIYPSAASREGMGHRHRLKEKRRFLTFDLMILKA